MDTKKLRQKILDLAIRGKLVPQDPNDEPASVLLERIRAEKERLIKEGKIKRSKQSVSDTPHYENVPFEIPDGWEWVTIEDVTVNRDAERIPVSLSVRKKQQNKVYDYYGAAGVIDKVENYIFDERLLLVGEDGANLLSRSKNNAFFADGKYWVNNHAHVLDCPNKSILDYIAFVINSMSLEDYITGSAQPKLTQDNLNKISIPLPPEKEQHRIIESVNYYFSNITLLEGEIKETTSFIQKAKSKILDLAIHGKLVPQDPNDEPAIELLKRINPKFTPCDNAHYENIPASWCYAKGKSIFLPMESTKPTGDSFLYVDVDAVNNKKNKITNPKSILSKQAPSRATRKLHEGDVLFSMVRPYLRNIAQVDRDYANAIASTGFYVITPTATIIQDYLFFMMQSSYVVDGLNQFMKGDNSPSITNKDIENYAYPIPPIKEQQRIVAAIKYYYRILDDISANL